VSDDECREQLLKRTPKGTRIAYLTASNTVIVTGVPVGGEGDDHNCDAMGCSSVSHVVERYRAVRL